MKRHPVLATLSREHHAALVRGRRAASVATDGDEARAQRADLLRRWPVDDEPHFAIEEATLLPLLAAAGHAGPAARARAEHDTLRALFARVRDGDLPALRAWGEAMRAHVRFEERELFPLAERALDLDPLAGAMARTQPDPGPDPRPAPRPISPTHWKTSPMSLPQPHAHLSPYAIYPFDARGIAKRFRHAAIFGALEALTPGETMRFVNDHDPLPLLGQLEAHYGERVGIEYQRREPGAIVIDFIKR